jgi:hypothetical protein
MKEICRVLAVRNFYLTSGTCMKWNLPAAKEIVVPL